jgi:heat shock protein HslJ
MTMRSTPLRLLALAAGVALVAAACGGDDDSSGSEVTTGDTAAPVLAIDGASYTSQDVTGYTLVADSQLTLSFDGDKIGANAGCNSMGGAYSVENGKLVIDGQMVSTQMFCDGLMDQDQWYSTFLTSSPSITQDGSNLTLSDGTVTITYLDDEVGNPDKPLEGTTWNVTGTIANEAVSSAPEGASIVLQDGTAQVNTGCNTGSATYEVAADGTTVTFGALALTKMACTDPALTDLEAAVVQTLDGTATATIDGSSMTLQSEAAGLQLTAG